MLTYKHLVLAEVIDSTLLTENYDSGDTQLLELMIEAPIDRSTVDKMINNEKEVSIYYQGDTKNKKGWYKVQPISAIEKSGKPTVKAYVVPKDGSKPILTYFEQSKIVNWNVLGSKSADLAKRYKKKYVKNDTKSGEEAPTDLSKAVEPDGDLNKKVEDKIEDFLKNPKVPKEKKKSILSRMKNVGVNVKRFLKKAGIAAALFGTFLAAKPNIDDFVRKSFPHVAQMVSPKDLSSKDFTEEQKKALGHVIHNAVERSGKEQGGTSYDDYPKEYAKYALEKKLLSPKSLLRQMESDPYIGMVATLGRFSYKKLEDGSYLVTDTYDFKKFKNINTTKEDIKGMPDIVAVGKIMKDNDTDLYSAIRHIAYLENPENGSDVGKKIKVIIPAEYVK